MGTLVMARFMVFLIGWLFRRGRVWGMTHQLVKCRFDIFEVGTLVLEYLNSEINRDNVGIDILVSSLF